MLIPLLIITACNIYTIAVHQSEGYTFYLQHYAAIAGNLLLWVLFFTGYITPLIITGIYLLAATANLLSLNPGMQRFTYGRNEAVSFNLLSLGILLLYLLLNNQALITLYLDYKGSRRALRK